MVTAITFDRQRWLNFMMHFELGLEKPDPKRAPISAGTIAASYVIGGLIPLLPYMMMSSISEAFVYSVGFTALALILFGGIKGQFTGINKVKWQGRPYLLAGSLQPLPTHSRISFNGSIACAGCLVSGESATHAVRFGQGQNATKTAPQFDHVSTVASS